VAQLQGFAALSGASPERRAQTDFFFSSSLNIPRVAGAGIGEASETRSAALRIEHDDAALDADGSRPSLQIEAEFCFNTVQAKSIACKASR
jgi:hypothetical protein